MADKTAVAKQEPVTQTAMTTLNPATMVGLMQSSKYLPRLQLMTSMSKQCKAGEFPINHYALAQDSSLQDLGTDVNVMLIAARLKAVEFGDEVISVFDPKLVDNKPTGEFLRIMDKSEIKDSNCMWGTEFLVYIPQCKCLAGLFFGSKTSRRDVPSAMLRLSKAATLKSKKIETKKYEYFSLAILPCSETIVVEVAGLDEEVERFLNPPASVVEGVDAAEKAATSQER